MLAPNINRITNARLESVNREKIRKLRSSTVKPVLGTLVSYLSMRRVNTRGIRQANKCMLMAAVAYNLKKLLKWQHRRIETGVIALTRELPAAILDLITNAFSHKTKPALKPVII